MPGTVRSLSVTTGPYRRPEVWTVRTSPQIGRPVIRSHWLWDPGGLWVCSEVLQQQSVDEDVTTANSTQEQTVRHVIKESNVMQRGEALGRQNDPYDDMLQTSVATEHESTSQAEEKLKGKRLGWPEKERKR